MKFISSSLPKFALSYNNVNCSHHIVYYIHSIYFFPYFFYNISLCFTYFITWSLYHKYFHKRSCIDCNIAYKIIPALKLCCYYTYHWFLFFNAFIIKHLYYISYLIFWHLYFNIVSSVILSILFHRFKINVCTMRSLFCFSRLRRRSKSHKMIKEPWFKGIN